MSQEPNQLTLFRQQAGLSRAQVAALVWCKRPKQIARYEREERVPSLRRAIGLAVVYGVSFETLFASLFARIREEVMTRKDIITAAMPSPDTPRILAVYPGTRRYGVAVFDLSTGRLVESRVYNVKIGRVPDNVVAQGKRLIGHLCDTWYPQTLIVEETQYDGSRRSAMLVPVATMLKALARKRRMVFVTYTPREMHDTLTPPGLPRTKAILARLLASQYPQLQPYLPRLGRSIGDAEPYYHALFMAVALGLVWMRHHRQRL
jgi:transcriptional regulator with XRE-family HTH domain